MNLLERAIRAKEERDGTQRAARERVLIAEVQRANQALHGIIDPGGTVIDASDVSPTWELILVRPDSVRGDLHCVWDGVHLFWAKFDLGSVRHICMKEPSTNKMVRVFNLADIADMFEKQLRYWLEIAQPVGEVNEVAP